MDVLTLSRIQFGITTSFHFLFVPLTLGLAVIIGILEIQYARSKDRDYQKLAKFFGTLFLINFALGVVTGIPLEFQFGTNWSKYSEYVGDIFGSLLAIEATLAFFLESTFIAVWAFTWHRVSAWTHAIFIWVVAIASALSAVWILIANSWMQNPVGYEIRNGRAELTDFFAVVTQEFAIVTILHTLFGAFLLAGFFVLGISAYHIIKKKNTEAFKKSFRTAAVFSLVFAVLVVYQGHMNAEVVAHKQPAKLAAMEALWETESNASIYMIAFPDEKNEKNHVEMIKIPGILSFLAFKDFSHEVTGLKEFAPEDRPPVWPTFVSFRLMVGLGFLFVLLAALGFVFRRKPENYQWYLKVMILAIPLPYIANLLGWMVTEIGRQPWIVYGIMRTTDGVSPIKASQVGLSLFMFTAVYSLLGALNFFLLYRHGTGDLPAAAAEKAKGDE